MAAVKKDEMALEFAGPNAKKDFEVMIECRYSNEYDRRNRKILNDISLEIQNERLNMDIAYYCYYTLGIALEKIIEDGKTVSENMKTPIILSDLGGDTCDIGTLPFLKIGESLKNIIKRKNCKYNGKYSLAVDVGDKVEKLKNPSKLQQGDLRKLYLRNDVILIVYDTPEGEHTLKKHRVEHKKLSLKARKIDGRRRTHKKKKY